MKKKNAVLRIHYKINYANKAAATTAKPAAKIEVLATEEAPFTLGVTVFVGVVVLVDEVVLVEVVPVEVASVSEVEVEVDVVVGAADVVVADPPLTPKRPEYLNEPDAPILIK